MTTRTKSAKARTSEVKAKTAKAPAKGLALKVPLDLSGRTLDAQMAHVAVNGIAGNARSLVSFGHATFGELSLGECAAVMIETAQSLNGGDLSAAVNLLAAQAIALNAMFGELARVGHANMFNAPDYADRCLRLAFKAQGQSRATLETLAAIKNPPVVFARQANINHGGQQQVNNQVPLTASHARAQSESGLNELLDPGAMTHSNSASCRVASV